MARPLPPFSCKKRPKNVRKKTSLGKEIRIFSYLGKEIRISFPREVFFRGNSFLDAFSDAFFVDIFWPLKAVLNIHLRFEFRLK